jgi:hypothetical protein
MRSWVWDADMPVALVADEIGLGKTFTLVAAAMICTLLTEKVVMGLPLSILWGNTLAEWVILAQNDFPRIIGEQREWYPLQRHNLMPGSLIAIQKTPPQVHPVLTSTLEPLLVGTMPRVAETFKSVIEEITFATDFKPINVLDAENAYLTHKDLITSLE